ncbi:hypothetical protein ACXIUS_03855 [Bosea thiooxidans]
MTMVNAPDSWRDLDHDELIALLGFRAPLVTRRDLLLAQWDVAIERAHRAENAEHQAFDARYLAPEFRTGRVTSKVLAEQEKADRRLARARSAAKAARRRADELGALFNAEPA